MVLHIKGYALQGLISPRHHSNVKQISSLKLSNVCITPLTNLQKAQRPYTDPLYKVKAFERPFTALGGDPLGEASLGFISYGFYLLLAAFTPWAFSPFFPQDKV